MCARFYIPDTDDDAEELAELLKQLQERFPSENPERKLQRGEIRPGMQAMVIAPNRSTQKPSLFTMQWGFHTQSGLLFNARLESAGTKPTFRNSWTYRRCLIPMTAYFELDHHHRPFQKYRFVPKTMDEGTLLAGIYRFEGQMAVFSVLTRQASSQVLPFHDRMPVILSWSSGALWMNSKINDVDEIVNTHAIGEVAASPVGGTLNFLDSDYYNPG